MADKPAPKKAAKAAKPSKPAPKAEPKPKAENNSKFAKFLAEKKLDGRRVLAISRHLEGLQPEDRQIRLNKRLAKKAEGDNAKKETRKPRSGRPVTHRALNAALTGGAISGPTKTRILKAVNHLLEQKKQPKVELKALF